MPTVNVDYEKKWVADKSEFTGNSTISFRGDCGVKINPVLPDLDVLLFDVQAMSYIVGGPGTPGEVEGQAVVGRTYQDLTGSGGPAAGHETDILMHVEDDRLIGLAHRNWNPEAGHTGELVQSATLRLHYASGGDSDVLTNWTGDPKPDLVVAADTANGQFDIESQGALTWFKSPTKLSVGADASQIQTYPITEQYKPTVTWGSNNVHTSGLVVYKTLALNFTTYFRALLDDIYTAEYYLREEFTEEALTRDPEMNLIIQSENWNVQADRNALFLHTSEYGYPQDPLKATLEVVIKPQVTPMIWAS